MRTNQPIGLAFTFLLEQKSIPILLQAKVLKVKENLISGFNEVFSVT